ncbi:serine hydrolase domain-containing protein [Microbacterium pygmaeum]|uniref:D-alanyl-D-alanine carboxypeptidase n=1 Tax=Microbacterium pygmaeum TaxID=370764 RepID=A0A1G7V167_9MICO|nr:serine hydrolase domain-containing protein [Microbacterium pygmaeum]SDG53464.1 D-alanyl-D-alanine carboxypeptidase [Microbacterium pygmaeum]
MRVGTTRRRGVAALSSALAGALALTLALSGCSADAHVDIDAPAQVDGAFPDDITQQLQDAVAQAMTATGSSGAIVGVWAPWSGSLVSGFGTESFGSEDAVTTDMEFRAGRITRPMICDVLFQLAAEKVVALDDPVTDYVSGAPDLADVTLQQLCDGTSGIGAYSDQLSALFFANPARVWNPMELASYGLGEPRTTAPGASYRDSDAGYVLLGLALERATNTSAADLLRQYVFDPLDLNATSLPTGAPAKASATGPVLNGHHSTADAAGVMNCTEPLDITTLSASSGFTDSGVVSTIDDLGRYAQALATGALAPSGSKRFDAPIAIDPAAPSWYATKGGAVIAGTLVGQFGSVPGYATAAFSDPTTGLTVAVVLNNSGSGGGPATNLAWELAALASKAPAADGAAAPEAGLPWTAQQYHDEIAARAICAAPAQ